MNDKSNPDYYPRIKINKRWYLAVPELDQGSHDGCAFNKGDPIRHGDSYCKLCRDEDSLPPALDGWDRWDCGSHSSIFVPPSKFPEYLAQAVAKRLEEA